MPESLCLSVRRVEIRKPLKHTNNLYSPIVLGEKSNQGVSLIESMAEAIAVAPKAIATSEFPKIATMTASAEAPLATTAVHTRFFKLMTSFVCRGEFYLADGQRGHAR